MPSTLVVPSVSGDGHNGEVPRLAVAAAVALLLVAGPATETATAAPAPARRVFVIGDSVMVGAAEAVRDALVGWDATVGAHVGLGTRGGTEALRERLAELGPVVVVELGLNDWGLAPSAFAGLVDDAMDVLAGRHVVWLTSPRFRPEVDGINEALRGATTRHAHLEVLEWGALVDAHPEATYADRIHLRPAGQAMLAGAVRAAIDGWWARTTAPSCTSPADDTSASNSVARLYHAFFLRPPDADGLAYWVPRYRSGELCLGDIAEVFARSPEMVAAYGALDIPAFVRQVYLNVLGREPDPDGYRHWAGLLAAGVLRRGDVMVGFSESSEFRSRTGLS
jgi:lysophospholipase L1-like esterase